MKFAPLHIVTGYTFLSSGLTIERVIKGIKANDYFGAGISDKEVMYGFPSFAKEMEGIKKPYLLGEEFEIEGDNLSLYAISEEGYRNLLVLNVANQKGELSFALLKEKSSGLVAILETIRGTFKEKFVEDYDSSFNKYLLRYAKAFGDNFYLGLEVTSKEGVKYANRVRKFADQFTYECIAFPRVRYEKKEDALILKMVNAIANDEKIDIKKEEGQDYFMKEIDYAKIYSQKEMANTIKVISSSKFNLHQKRGELLHYPVDNAKEALSSLCFNRLKELKKDDESHISRLKYELDIINQMGYNDYFLIVQDLVNHAKEEEILVGPGRGSAAGSLVSHLLGIVEIDPLDFNLQFERFLNPYRQTMPDIDVDFMDTRRDEMVSYMREKYGADRVANIVTFQTIGAKQSLRDIGRIYNYPNHHIDLLCKKISEKDYSLRDAYKKLPDFKSIIDSDKYFLEIVSLASKIEGLPRQSGIHAAGVVLDEKPIAESVPVSVSINDECVCQYEKEFIEEQGLLKMDLLSLSNLSIIYNCVELINHNHPEAKLNPYSIPYNEKEIFDLISKNKTLGLFQIETPLMRKSIKVLKPTTFDDVVALLALGRPGPMKYIPNYAKRRDGKEKYSFLSEDLKEILGPTYGIIIYQEQINSIATKIAGFSLAEADRFRRAISKKDKDKLVSLEKQFIEGTIKKGYDQELGKKVFADILEFAEYGFNKSHSVVYSIITCRLGWLKVHYPLEFYASLLQNGASTKDSKFSEYISEMNSLNIKMLPPSINYSNNSFVIKDDAILFPLTGIKDINITIYQKIIEERNENGLFKDFFNFALRMFAKRISNDQMQNLISAGAFDEFYPSRESMRRTVLSALQYAELNYDKDGQLSLGIDFVAPPRMNVGKDDPLDNLDKEYQVLGVMLSNNPLSYKKDLLNKLKVISIDEAKELNRATIAGIVKDKKVITTKAGAKMAFVKLFDESGEIEITVFPKQYEENVAILNKNSMIVIEISLRYSREEVSYIAQTIKKLEEE